MLDKIIEIIMTVLPFLGSSRKAQSHGAGGKKSSANW